MQGSGCTRLTTALFDQQQAKSNRQTQHSTFKSNSTGRERGDKVMYTVEYDWTKGFKPLGPKVRCTPWERRRAQLGGWQFQRPNEINATICAVNRDIGWKQVGMPQLLYAFYTSDKAVNVLVDITGFPSTKLCSEMVLLPMHVLWPCFTPFVFFPCRFCILRGASLVEPKGHWSPQRHPRARASGIPSPRPRKPRRPRNNPAGHPGNVLLSCQLNLTLRLFMISMVPASWWLLLFFLVRASALPIAAGHTQKPAHVSCWTCYGVACA